MIDLASIELREVPAFKLRPGRKLDWTQTHRNQVFDALEEQGWALVRGTGIENATDFSAAVTELGFDYATNYVELPFEGSRPGVFLTTDYPSEETIYFHSEAAHMAFSPKYIVFASIQPALSGGLTPLSDNFSSFSALPEEIALALHEQGLRYERSFIPGLDVAWQSFFGTTDRDKAKEIAAKNEFEVEWRSDDLVRTWARRSATLPRSDGKNCLFQQIALHHPAFLDPELRDSLTDICEGLMPRNVTLGSGKPLPAEWAYAIHKAQCESAFSFEWHSSDILFIDNIRISHARTPFIGQRRHLVMLSRFSRNLGRI